MNGKMQATKFFIVLLQTGFYAGSLFGDDSFTCLHLNTRCIKFELQCENKKLYKTRIR